MKLLMLHVYSFIYWFDRWCTGLMIELRLSIARTQYWQPQQQVRHQMLSSGNCCAHELWYVAVYLGLSASFASMTSIMHMLVEQLSFCRSHRGWFQHETSEISYSIWPQMCEICWSGKHTVHLRSRTFVLLCMPGILWCKCHICHQTCWSARSSAGLWLQWVTRYSPATVTTLPNTSQVSKLASSDAVGSDSMVPSLIFFLLLLQFRLRWSCLVACDKIAYA